MVFKGGLNGKKSILAPLSHPSKTRFGNPLLTLCPRYPF
jgi:hypothetical protein